jgi:phosphoenolpyruvate-protein kinase (PTS system EI component)
MKRLFQARTAGAVLVLLGLPACTFVNNLIRGTTGPADVDDLVAAVEKVNGELDASKESMLAAVQGLQKITAPDFQGDAVKAHEDLVDLIEKSEDQTKDLRKAVEKMQAAAAPVFDQWTKDLEAYANPEMRQRSQERLAASRERYDAVVAAVEPVLVQCEAINETLGDHALFLRHDMNPAAIATIQDDVKKVAKEAADMEPVFRSSRAAAMAYVEATAQPKAPEPKPEEKAVPVKGS